MMKEEVVVEVLHQILCQRSDNIFGDCCKIIESLLESLQCTKILSVNRTLCSVKLLLSLCKKIHLNDPGIESILSVEKILQKIMHVNKITLLDKCAQNDLLSIISVLCEIGVTCKIPNFNALLTSFYNDIFCEILEISRPKEYGSEKVIFLLKILCTLYSSKYFKEILTDNLKQANDDVMKTVPFALLALHGNESIAMQTSLFLIPEFVKLFKTNEPIMYIWTEFFKCSSPNYSRIFLILCNFASVSSLNNDMNLIEFLVEKENYWELIQYGLVKKDGMMRKQAMYLFKKTIDELSKKRETEKDISEPKNLLYSLTGNMLEGNPNHHWDPNRRDELIKIYSDIIIILEYLNEEQVHIVRPIFEMVEKIIEKTVQCDLINFSWILLIYEFLLMHESTEVNKWGIKTLLKVPGKVFVRETEVEKTAILLSSNLNNINLYYNNGLEITEALGSFFQNIVQLKTAKLFFKSFIKEVCKLVWCPEALFFVTSSFSKLRELSFWDLEEIDEIRMFVSKAFTTHNKTIRNGIQCEILKAVLALTHSSHLPLYNMILLFSKFATEVFRSGSRTSKDVITYLKRRYSKEDAKKILDLFLNSSQHNEKCAALCIILFHSAFEDDFASKTFLGLLSSFKNAKQRPYCDVSTLNRYFLIINDIVEKYTQRGENSKLIALVFPFLEDMVLFIHSQARIISSLSDFTICNLHLKTFENLTKLVNVSKRECNFESLFKRLLESLESDLCFKVELSSVQKYFAMSLIKIIYESFSHKLEPNHLNRHLLQNLNELLKKEENAKDVQMIWGKINSEFFKAKWVILENLIRNEKIQSIDDKTQKIISVPKEDLLKMCIEGLDVGGYGVLCPVIRILGGILPHMNDVTKLENVVDTVWTIILERRSTDDFKFCVENFVKMLFCQTLCSKTDVLQVLIKYIDLIFSDCSLVMVSTLVTHAKELEVSDYSLPVLCQILGKGLLFGPVQKKDDKLTAQVCSYVQSFWECQESESITSSKIRARAAHKLLSIRNKKGVAKGVMDVLMQVEGEITQKRTRYFGNSFIHHIKIRFMQGILLLLDSCENEEKKKIAEWIYLSLMTENPQTSVRNLQEWSLSLLYESYSFFNYFRDSVKKTPKGRCSLMTIAYLLAKASFCDIDEAIREILPFCMDQHFEARLYAEVVILKLYCLAEELRHKEVLEKWRVVHDCIQQSISRAEGNAFKNYVKLEKHFFFNGFNITTHYSLQTIFYDLPRLANVSSDEWISPLVFDSLSVSGAYDLDCNIFNTDQILQQLNNSEWLIQKSEECSNDLGSKGKGLENYQKKMIPVKPLNAGCNKRDLSVMESLEKEGLIVVASLIDRTPNLGGLARTCEVFGATQLVLNTTKCLEDKDFKSVSVTAEKWIQVKEVKTESLLEYIVEMKESGFQVIGAEQAVHSEPLTKTKFPRKCLLVLGNEKKGIPPNLIPLLDVCVEIPQTGIIRSLNVHVTGALFLWEYAKQNLFLTD